MRMLTTLSSGNRRSSSFRRCLLCSAALMLSLFLSGPLTVSANWSDSLPGYRFLFEKKFPYNGTVPPAFSGSVDFGRHEFSYDGFRELFSVNKSSYKVNLSSTSAGKITGTIEDSFSAALKASQFFAYGSKHFLLRSEPLKFWNLPNSIYAYIDADTLVFGFSNTLSPTVSASSGVSVENFSSYMVCIIDGVEYRFRNNSSNYLDLDANLPHQITFHVELEFDALYSVTYGGGGSAGSVDVDCSYSVAQPYLWLRAKYTTFQSYLFSTLSIIGAGLHDDLMSIKAGLTLDRTNELLSQGNQLQQENNNKLDNLTTGYDSTAGNSTNDKLSGSLDSFASSEDAIVGGAESGVNALDIGIFFDFAPGLISGLSLVTVFVNGFMRASGDLGFIYPFLYVLVFVTLVMGLWRFRR